jgi:hypothetical protein
MDILPIVIYRFNEIPNKIPMLFFTRVEKLILKFIWKHERPPTAKKFLIKYNMEAAQYLQSHNKIIMELV